MTYVPAIKNLSGTNSGDQTNITGNAATVTTNANLAGDVSSVGNTTTIGPAKVTEAMQVLADNTTANASTTAHGYLKKLPNDAAQYLNGVGNWVTPSGGGSPYCIRPTSCVPVTTDRVFANVHVGAGSNSKHTEGFGVQASVGADSTWRFRFPMPKVLPSGTCKLKGFAIANATSGAAKFNPKWASVADQEAPDTATLNAEGVQTITWAGGDADTFQFFVVMLDADTPVGNEIIVMDVVFETSGFTLAQISTWDFWVEFES